MIRILLFLIVVFALGLEDQLEGVTFECNWPPAARNKAVISGTVLPVETLNSASAIDEAVRAVIAAGEPIYTLDGDPAPEPGDQRRARGRRRLPPCRRL